MLTEEIIALGERYLPWPENGASLRPPGELADGLRLSNDCGACRILDYFHKRRSYVSQGVSLAGHMYADIFIQSLLPDHVMVEREFDWICGKSGMDGLILKEDCPYRAHYEFKTSSKPNPKPLAYNIRQVIRQRVVIARELGLEYDKIVPSVIFIMEKAGAKSSFIRGPFEVTPTEQQYRDAEMDIDLTTQVYLDVREDGVDPIDHPLLKKLQRSGCHNCFPMPQSEADALLSKLVDEEYHRKNKEYEKLKDWRDKHREEKIRPLVEVGQKVVTDKYEVSHTTNGRLLISKKK